MKKGILAVFAGAILVFVAGFSVTAGTSDTESSKQQNENQKSQQQEKASKIIDNGIKHNVSVYRQLPGDVKSYLKQNPKMLKELVKGSDPKYMNSLNDAMHLLDEVDKEDAKYLYENDVEKLYKMVPNGNNEKGSAKKVKPNEKLIQKLQNN